MQTIENLSVNWSDSSSVLNHYNNMIIRHLKHKGISDFTKYEFSLEGHTPVFSKWEYPNIRKPCVNRMKRLSKNKFKFNLVTTIQFVNSNINIARPENIKIETSENNQFRSGKNFIPPLYSFTVLEIKSLPVSGFQTGVRAPVLVNVRINPLKVEKIQNDWYLFFIISADKVCKLKVRFSMTYLYHLEEDDNEDSSTLDTVVVNANVENTNLPPTENSDCDRESDSIESEEASVTQIPLQRSSSLRSSLRTVTVPPQLKNEFESINKQKPNQNKVFYELDEKTQKRLNKNKSSNKPNTNQN